MLLLSHLDRLHLDISSVALYLLPGFIHSTLILYILFAIAIFICFCYCIFLLFLSYYYYTCF